MFRKLNNMQPQTYVIEKPNLKQVDKENIFTKLEKNPKGFQMIYEKANEPRYLYWDRLQYKLALEGFKPEELWFLVRQFRNVTSVSTPIKSETSDHFRWVRLSYNDEFLHKIDKHSGGDLFPKIDISDRFDMNVFISIGIIEEAIASSQLEGAHTTREAAREMLLQNREPKNKSEHMILNNYKTIMQIDEEYKKSKLSLDLLFELHTSLTKNTVDRDEQNRLRNDNDRIIVQGQLQNKIYVTHIPPKHEFIKSELFRLIEYANDQDETRFIHPIIKAIFIHFWIGYLHPFTDGNGRLARALFYWYLLNKGYWTFMYLPISTVIKKAPNQYAMAYIYAEQDNYDITYFYDFHMHKIIQSIDDLKNYIARKLGENRAIDKALSKDIAMNDRQKQTIHYLLADHSGSVTTTSHKAVNSISRQTAAKDLKALEDMGFLEAKREGKYIRYFGTDKLRANFYSSQVKMTDRKLRK